MRLFHWYDTAMLIVDSHLDIAWNALQWNRNLELSVNTLRTLEGGIPGKGRAQNTVCFPEMRRGKVFLSFATLLARSTGSSIPHIDYPTAEQAFATARGQYAYYQALAKRGVIQQIRSREHLKSHLTAWQTWEGEQKAEQPPLGFLISMESADPILKPDELEEWWQLGVRSIGPAHYGPGRYAGGTSTEEGLSDIGFHLLKEMERLGIILDLTHLSDKAFWQALEHFSGKVIASHNNCRALVPHQRQFSDEQLLSIIERDGVIGVAFDTWMLEPGWIKGESTNAGVGIAKVLDHIDHICALAGNSHNVGIGSDLDGGFGLEQSPHDLDTIADLALFPQLLKARDYKQTDIENIMHGNWLRFLEQALPET